MPEKGGRGRLRPRIGSMSIRARGLCLFLAAAALAALLAVPALAESVDPIRVSSLSDPQSVVNEQDVNITIKIYNNNQNDLTGEITLYGPDGVSVDKYAGLAGEQSVTYTGVWHVTPDQIAEGRVKYYIQYYVDAGDGPKQTIRTIPVAIQGEAAAPQLSATYSVSPAAAREGQDVTLTYTLQNSGNVELRNIVIKNEGVTDEDVTIASLSVGEKVSPTSVVTMGTEPLLSNPTITYEAADTGRQLTISDMPRRTITLAEDGLEASISGEGLDNLYPGEETELTVTLKNTGETAYSGLSVALPDGTTALTGVELAAGATFEDKLPYTASGSGKVSVTVSGQDESGESVAVVSNELDIKTQDASQALILRVRAQACETTIYSEPAVVRFAVVVDNIGETDATTLSVEQAGKQVATIPSLPSGESRTLVFDVETSIAGKFQFEVTGKDAGGNERAYTSNIIDIGYVEPTPAPTATPAPTPVPPTPSPVPTATPAPTLKERIAASVNPTVLYVLAAALSGIIAVVLVVTGISGARRRKRMKNALDTIALSPDVRNHKGARRRRAAKPEKEAQSEPIVPTPELTDEEAEPAPAKEEAPRTPEAPEQGEETHRRRNAAEEPEETLRVVPVDQRPEFVAQGKVDDSETRVFNRVGAHHERRIPEPPKPENVWQLSENAPEPPEMPPAPQPVAAPAPDIGRPHGHRQEGEELRPADGGTIRLNTAELSALREKQSENAGKAKNAAKGAKKEKNAKKKKSLFARREDEDDFVEGEQDGEPDDDLFE